MIDRCGGSESAFILFIASKRSLFMARMSPVSSVGTIVVTVAAPLANISFTYISKMYFRRWKSPRVSERMYSVTLDVSISGEYQTLRGHSSWPSE